MATLTMILGAAAFIKQAIPVGLEIYNLVKAYGSNFPPDISRSDAVKTVKGLIAKLRQEYELHILQAENKLKDCPDIRQIPDAPGHPLYDAKQQCLASMQRVRDQRSAWCDALETLWEEYEAQFNVLTEVEIEIFNVALLRAEGPQAVKWSPTQVDCSEMPATTRDAERTLRGGSKGSSTMRTNGKSDADSARHTGGNDLTRGRRPSAMKCPYPTDWQSTARKEATPPTAYTTQVVSQRKGKLAHSQASMATGKGVESLVTATRNLTIKAPKTVKLSSRRLDSSPLAPEIRKSAVEAPKVSVVDTSVRSTRDPVKRSNAIRAHGEKPLGRVGQLRREEAGEGRRSPSGSSSRDSSSDRREDRRI